MYMCVCVREREYNIIVGPYPNNLSFWDELVF